MRLGSGSMVQEYLEEKLYKLYVYTNDFKQLAKSSEAFHP